MVEKGDSLVFVNKATLLDFSLYFNFLLKYQIFDSGFFKLLSLEAIKAFL